MANIRKRGTRWQVQVRRSGHPPITRSFGSRADAAAWARRVEGEIDRGESPDTGTVRLIDIYTAYERESGASWGRSKRQSLAWMMRDEHGLGRLRLRGLTTNAIMRFSDRRRDEGAGPVTVGKDLRLLGVLLRRGGAILGVSVTTPLERLREASALLQARHAARPSSHERDRRPTPEEHDLLMDYWARSRSKVPMGDVWLLAVSTGLRLGEIVRLTWGDYDWANRMLTVRARKHPTAKEDNTQTIPLLHNNGVDPAEIIARQPRRSLQPNERIFPYAEQSVSNAFRRTCAACGIEDLRFHDARHHAVSGLFESGYQIQQVALVSGHRSWKNLQRYTNLRPQDLHDHPSQVGVSRG
jgi:integrase